MSSLLLTSLAASSACGFSPSSPCVDMLSLSTQQCLILTPVHSQLSTHLPAAILHWPLLLLPYITSPLCFCVKESKVIRATTRQQQTTLPSGCWRQHDMPTDTQAHSHHYYHAIILLLLKMWPKKALCFSLSVAPNLSISLPPSCNYFSPIGLPPLSCACPCPAVETLLTGLWETIGAFQAVVRQTDRDRSE